MKIYLKNKKLFRKLNIKLINILTNSNLKIGDNNGKIRR